MSRKAKLSDHDVALTVIRTSGQKEQMRLGLDRSLRDLKRSIAQSETLGGIPEKEQRLFHLGRELKTLGRSLENLGVGRFGIMTIHVHTVSSGSPKNGEVEVPPAAVTAGAASASASAVVDLADDDDSDDVVEVVEAPKRRRLS